MAGVKGRGSAGHVAVVAMMVAVGLLAMAPAANATNHVVGGTTQEWNYATNGYSYDSQWSPTQTFVVGDTLEFKYVSGHNVVQYATKAEYDACTGAAVQTWTSGDDTVPLNSTGAKYYICSFPGHCAQGMKVSVTVAAAATPPTVAPANSPSTTTPSSPPPTTPSTRNGASSGPILSMAGLLGAALVAAPAFLV